MKEGAVACRITHSYAMHAICYEIGLDDLSLLHNLGISPSLMVLDGLLSQGSGCSLRFTALCLLEMQSFSLRVHFCGDIFHKRSSYEKNKRNTKLTISFKYFSYSCSIQKLI